MSGRLRQLIAWLAGLSPEAQAVIVGRLPESVRREINEAWDVWGLPGQDAPANAWRVWLIQAGRGFGKTRAGAEWVSAYARRVPKAKIALVGATRADVRQVMVQGPSGVITVARDDEALRWNPTRGEIHWPNGAVATVYSAEAPEKLRGPEHHIAWCDELAKWRNGDATWDNLQMTMRLGETPQVLVTTTPRQTSLMRRVGADRGRRGGGAGRVFRRGRGAAGAGLCLKRQTSAGDVGPGEDHEQRLAVAGKEVLDDRVAALRQRAAGGGFEEGAHLVQALALDLAGPVVEDLGGEDDRDVVVVDTAVKDELLGERAADFGVEDELVGVEHRAR